MSRHLATAYLGGVAVVAIGRQLASAPATLDRLWVVVAWSAAAAVATGVAVHRPRPRGPWLLMVTGLTATAVGNTLAPATAELPQDGLRAITGTVLHLAAYLMIGGTVLWFIRLQSPDGDRDSLLDGSIVTVALATVLWSVLIDPVVLGPDVAAGARVVLLVVPLLPAGITALCIRMVIGAGWRLPAARLLGGAWILAFLGSIGWVLLLQADAFAPGGWPDLVWIAALGCAGASALHPSMVQMGHPVEQSPRSVSAGRLTVLGIALLATPVALLATIGVEDLDAVVPVAGAGLIALLVLGRLTQLVHERERDRHELEVHAARQGVVARVGRAALGERSVASVCTEAAELVTGVLDDVVVTAHGEDGDLRVVPVGGRSLTVDEEAFCSAVRSVLSGMAARRHAEADLRQRALYDGLTGLPNRTLVLERLDQAVRRRDRGPVGVLFVDLDGFKPINDAHGHGIGDHVLASLARRLPRALRGGDTLGRLAGDEFVIVAPDCDEIGLAELAGRLLATVTEPVEVGGASVAVSASIGATLAGDGQHDASEVLRRADSAMYRAKESGGAAVATL